jgi:FkbM family methyltransferase
MNLRLFRVVIAFFIFVIQLNAENEEEGHRHRSKSAFRKKPRDPLNKMMQKGKLGSNQEIITSIEDFDAKYKNISDPIPLSVKNSVVLYQVHQAVGQVEFEGAADFHLAPIVSKLLLSSFLRSQEHLNIIVIGLFHGELLRELVKCLPESSYSGFGFEIDAANYATAAQVLAPKKDVSLFRMGVSNTSGFVTLGGAGQTAGLYEENAVAKRHPYLPKASPKNNRVEVTSLLEFVSSKKKLEKVHYLTIDVEGHETMVLQGMRLDKLENRKLFSLFQMELGGTWVVSDPRHPVGSSTQFETILYLENLGYQFFLIGMRILLPVSSEFFRYGPKDNENDVIAGNVLVIHKEYADPIVWKYLKSNYRDYEEIKQILLTKKYPKGDPPTCESISI